jgi:hypothetical protein
MWFGAESASCNRVQHVVGAAGCVIGLLGCVLLAALVGVAHAALCPNEVLRGALGAANLPDCRAYELVSPPAKNGWFVVVAGANEKNVLMRSVGGFADSNQTTITGLYDAERNGNGWTTKSFAPVPSGLTAEGGFQAASSDLDSGLFYYIQPLRGARSVGLYTGALPDGGMTEVGPIYSQAALSAGEPSGGGLQAPSASNDLGHILFGISGPSPAVLGAPNFLWREIGDSTVENTGPLYGSQGFDSLYEYAGTQMAHPALVGLDSGGHLISQCGTSLGYPLEGNFARLASEETFNAISGDGSRVFFTAAAADEGPAPGSHHCTEDGEGYGPSADALFARSGGSVTTAISLPSTGPGGDCSACSSGEPQGESNGSVGEGAVFQGAASDGSKAFFLTTWPLLKSDRDHALDLYEYDFGAVNAHEKIVQVSRGSVSDPTPGEGAFVRGVSRVSEDGSHVYFVAEGKLTGEPRGGGCLADLSAAELAEEEEKREGSCRPKKNAANLYVYNTITGKTAFIGTLLPADAEDWEQKDARPVDATPDGRFLVFTSSADLTPGDIDDVPQVFEYSAEAETLVRVSIGQNGHGSDQYGATIVYPEYIGSQNPAPQLTSVSDDGSLVVFQSSDALTPTALQGLPNVYEYRNGVVSLLSDGQDRTYQLGEVPSTALVGMDGSGNDIFFTTADRLVPQDGDTQQDVYDARVDGGFAPLVAPITCEGDGCQGALGSAPAFLTNGSTDQAAGEQVVEASTPERTRSKPKRSSKHKKAKARKRVKFEARRTRRTANHVARHGRRP